MTDTLLPNGIKDSGGDSSYFRKGCNPFAQTGRSKLQNKRASLNQQIIKEMRLRAGAENLLKATSNNKVKEMVLLELSYVNSNLQLLMGQLEGLNSSVEVYQNTQETASIPLIALGLKETKDIDFSILFKDFILEHYSEDGNSFEDEIADLMDLRQACRTPSRDEAGVELLAKYSSHLPLMESRFFSPSRQTGIFFTWYDSFTGVPVCQQNLSLEKASILFNMAALYSQIGTRSDRQTVAGLEEAISSFQRSAGILNHLKETFTHTPSYDMSPAMLSMLIRMMLAQAQECLFEKTALPGIRNQFQSLMKVAQEAAKVSEIYDQVHQSMIQTPIKDNVPFFWSTMSRVKTNHYRSMAHYFVASALLDHELGLSDDEDQQEKTLSQVYDRLPEGRSPLDILKRKDERERIGKAHIRRAIRGHEEALRSYSLCHHLNKLDILQDILKASLQRSLNKCSENEDEEFTDYTEAPDIISKTEHKAEMEVPTTTKVKVTDFFQRLGPLSFFSAKQRWTAPRSIQLRPEDRDLGFTLKGETPVQVVSLDPLCPAAADGLKEGDYIVVVGDTDCRWMGVSDVMRLLKDVNEEGIELQVVSVMDSNPPMPTKSATFCGNLPKTYSMICLAYDEDEKNPRSRKKHISHGLIPAASIAPKPAVPRTPPPRSPNPSPERPRSALAAAILSSSLTGQTWAIPPARPRSFSESGQSESFITEPNISTALFIRDRWSEDLSSRPHLSSPDHSEDELEDKEEEVESEEDREEHIYQTLDREESCSIPEPVYSLPLKPKTSTPQLIQIQMSGRRVPSPDFPEETSLQPPEASCDSSKKKVRKSHGSQKEDVPSALPILTTNPPSQAKNPKQPTQLSAEPSKASDEVQREVAWALPEKSTRMADEQKLLEERLQRLEQEISHSQASSNPRSSAGSQAELLNLRQHAQELVDENDALKLTVHRLNVELSRYQTKFRPLSKQESSRISGLPKTGPPPPWLLDMKYLSPLLLAYEDRMKDKDALLQTTEEEVKRMCVHVEEVVKENERLHDEIAKIGGVSQKNSHQLQQQALLVLQENQVLIDQLEAQHVKTKESQSRHRSEVSKVTKKLMLLEAEKQRLQEDLEETRREVQKSGREVQVLQARLKEAITWDEHCNIAGELRRRLEQQESQNKSEMDKLLLRLSSLQEENRSLALDKANLTADIKRMEAEQAVTKQANRKAERRMSVLKRQKEEYLLKEEKTQHYMGAVISVAQHISQERDQLLQMASVLQQEKQGFVSRILKGTVRFGKLQEEVKVYRRQASTRLAVLEEAAEGRTASYHREILHLQRLLRERQEAEERLLQSKREVEEELEVVWQAATRENQQICAAHQSPGLQRRSIVKAESDHQNNSLVGKHKDGLDFYC